MMEQCKMKRLQVPAFGYWDYCDELPVTHYFESAVQAGLIRRGGGHCFEEDDGIFDSPALARSAFHHRHHHHHHHRKVKKIGHGGGGGDHKPYDKEQQRKQGKAADPTRPQAATPRRPRAPKAVDEDLYKIPPELLFQKPKRKRMLRNLWSGCMGRTNSIA